MKQISKRDFQKLASKSGFIPVRCKGDHIIYKNREGKIFSIPYRNPKSVVMLRLVKEYQLDA